MAIKFGLSKLTYCMGAALFLSACGGGGSDGPDTERVVCTAPQVVNSAGTACVNPPEENNAPEITSAAAFSVTEGSDNGSTVYTAVATDADGDSLSWSLTDGQGIFAIDAATGVITISDNTNLVAETLPSYTISITVTDDNSDAKSDSLTITVTVDEDPTQQTPEPSVMPGDNQAVIYYLREDDDYTGWTIHAWNNSTCNGYAAYGDEEGTEWTAGLTPDGTDDNFGAYWLIDVKDGASCLNYIVHNGDAKDPDDNDQLFDLDSSDTDVVFVVSGDAIYYDAESALNSGGSNGGGGEDPSVTPTSSQGAIYYFRQDGDYTGWALHAWNNETCNGYDQFADDGSTEWTEGLEPTGTDDNYGVYWLFDTKAGADCANFIIHNGDAKDPGDSDHTLSLTGDRWVFAVSGVGLFTDPDDVTTDAPFAIQDAAAHFIGDGIIVTQLSGDSLKLVSSSNGSLDENFDDSNALMLSSTTLSAEQQARVPHLTTSWNAYEFTATTAEQKALLKQQLVVASFDAEEAPVAATFVQFSKALDVLYTVGEADADEVTDYGITYDSDAITAKVWGPTATDIKLVVYDANKTEIARHDMNYDDMTGVWSYTTADGEDYDRSFFKYQVEVYHPVTKRVETTTATDPYSANTSTNGRYSQFVNMMDEDLKPAGWDAHSAPTLANKEDGVILEAHIRDFSINDMTTTAANRGKYMAFTENGTDANNYLDTLAGSGVNIFHMLPANDIATIEEDESQRIDLTNTVGELCARNSSAPVCGVESDSAVIHDVLAGYDPSTNDARDLINSLRGLDGFNWGYDPHHFNVVEGSYSSDPDGVARIKEFREMVQALHAKGMRVVLDVVYNHTSSSGLYDNSVFDKVVPGYYHRYNEVTGIIERSTCCENTATENRMIGKVVIDSLVHWAKYYGLDGFRFDVMGHMPADVILDGRDAVAEIDPDTYFYGEGWNWGEVANNRLFFQATQYNLADSEVGTFNDRPRDTIRAAALSKSTSSLSDIDHIRLGLAGTLQNYELVDQNGDKRKGVNFGQSSYALDPADIINYVSKHDNETLWDFLQYTQNLPTDMSADSRVRIHSLSAAIPVLSQGLPFFQLGVDKLRSKSLDRNTYDAGDWFNAIDYTNMSNNWNVGLPIERADSFNEALASNANSAVDQALIERSSSVFNEFIQIRQSSELFRLTDESQVIRRLGFHNTGPNQTKGLIVMSIDDGVGVTDLDSDHDAVVVVINGTDSQQSHTITSATGFSLHPVQMSSADTTVQSASFTEGTGEGTFTVPAYTIAVFVKEQGAEQGTGLAADPEYVNSPYGDAELFVSGLSDSAIEFAYDGRGTYSASVTLDAGDAEFSVADADASAVDLMLSDVAVADDSLSVSEGSGESFAVTVTTSGTYQIALDVTADTPELSVTLLNALVSCEAPVSAGAAPFSIAGDGSLYVRGDHSGWDATDAYRMTYIGNNQYKAVADFDGDFQFKLASSDGSWTTQLWAQNNEGNIETSNLMVGTSYSVAYNDAGTSNNAMSVSAGTYSFLLSLNEADPAQGTEVGTLLIEQCSE